MSAKNNKPPIGDIVSNDLAAYQLNKPLLALFQKFDKLAAYMALANKTPPCVRLRRVDYMALAERIRQQSAGKINLARVTYKGFRILSED